MPPRTVAVCSQKLHILFVVVVCKLLVAAEEVGIPQLVHLHVWGHARPSGARGAGRCKKRQRASDEAHRARNLRITWMAFVMHGTTNRKMATMKMLIKKAF
jgi:hypothetical protein